jgi:hypothetical protein
MQQHFAFSTVQLLWTLTFAAQLVLLVVLLGRDRARRFPWFTASLISVAVRVLTARLLFGRLPRLTYGAILICLADISVALGLMVLVELAFKAFRGAGRIGWIVAGTVMLAVGATVTALWGAWPAWKTLTANSRLAFLLVMQLAARKGELLLAVSTIELGLLILLFAGRYGARWRSHTQKIMIGLSTAAIAQLATQGILESISTHAAPKTRQEYEHLIALGDRITNANGVVYIAVLVWWIAWLWRDEPGGQPAAEDAALAAAEPAEAGAAESAAAAAAAAAGDSGQASG